MQIPGYRVAETYPVCVFHCYLILFAFLQVFEDNLLFRIEILEYFH